MKRRVPTIEEEIPHHVESCVCDDKGRDPDCYRTAKSTTAELLDALVAVHPSHPQPEICAACALVAKAGRR